MTSTHLYYREDKKFCVIDKMPLQPPYQRGTVIHDAVLDCINKEIEQAKSSAIEISNQDEALRLILTIYDEFKTWANNARTGEIYTVPEYQYDVKDSFAHLDESSTYSLGTEKQLATILPEKEEEGLSKLIAEQGREIPTD